MSDDAVERAAHEMLARKVARELERRRDRTLEHAGPDVQRSGGAFHWECDGCSTRDQDEAALRDHASIAGHVGRDPFGSGAADARRCESFVISLPRRKPTPGSQPVHWFRLCRRCAVKLAVAVLSDDVG